MPNHIMRQLVMLIPLKGREFLLNRVLPKAISTRIVHFFKNSSSSLVTTLDRKLWGGFSKYALIDLEELKRSEDSSTSLAADAALVLAIWYGSHGDFQTAYENVIFALKANPNLKDKHICATLHTSCLIALHKHEEAKAIIDAALFKKPLLPNLQLTRANCFATREGILSDSHEVSRLEQINKLFIHSKLAPICKIDPNQPLKIDNICAPCRPCNTPISEQPRISILVPCYSASNTLHFAIDSLLKQTWGNIEIIFVDDCSPDDSFAIAQQIASQDSRIRTFQMEKNSGAYAARNFALRHATGQFVTVHDADDWSHPQKLEIQIKHLLKHPKIPVNASEWTRCLPHLFFSGPAHFSSAWISFNHSSLMIKRRDLIELGGWDEVRVAADTELIQRIKGYYNLKSIPSIQAGTPLAFAMESQSSLTRISATHVFTLRYGLRRNYHDAANYYREKFADKNGWALPAPNRPRAFPAPKLILAKKPAPEKFNALVIMDFGLHGGAYVSTLNYILAAVAAGLRVAIFQWQRYDLNPQGIPNKEIQQLIHEEMVYLVSSGEEVDVTTVIVGYPVILQYAIDSPPKINCARFAIITNQMHARLYSGGDIQYDPSRVTANVEQLFGISPVWIPISNLVRDLMIKDGRYQPIHSETWTPLIEVEQWCTSVQWRGGQRKSPKIGRHSRDHYTKWPQTRDAIITAYCVHKPCTVELLGGAQIPCDILSKVPKNWNIHPFNSMDSLTFLRNLDFYVHYPHEDYIEEFGRATLEAMAVGVPVILPAVFKATFGDAALYAEPEMVWETIKILWNDKAAWEKRSVAGRNFVEQHGGWENFHKRFEALAAP